MGKRKTPHPATMNYKRWRALRLKIFARDNFRCIHCSKAGRLELDHISPVWQQAVDVWDESNLATLCRGCHIQKTRTERRKPNTDRDAWTRFIEDRAKQSP